MGYEGCMGFLHTYPTYHVGNEKNLWDLRGYGLSGVWVKRGSAVLYQFYNANLLNIPKSKDKDTMAYVNNSNMIAIADNFEEAHVKLADMMGRVGGVAEWSTMHNSPLEYSKLTLIDFAHSQSPKTRLVLHLPQQDVKPVTSTKYLDVLFNQNLNWKVQQAHTIKKGTNWAAQIRRITKQTWGITPKYARCLCILNSYHHHVKCSHACLTARHAPS